MRTEDMWITMTFIQMVEAVLDPQLMHAHPYGELPVCCVHELSTSGAVSNDSWATVLRMMRRFAKPNAAPSSKGGGGGGGSGMGGGGPSGLGLGSGLRLGSGLGLGLGLGFGLGLGLALSLSLSRSLTWLKRFENWRTSSAPAATTPSMELGLGLGLGP